LPKQLRAEAKFKFEPLESEHDRAAFSCGVAALDNYLQKQAGQDVKKHAAVAFVMTADGRTIAGYYTLSQYSIRLDDVPEEVAKKLPKYPNVPATLLGRLAVSKAFQGQKLGMLLLMDALYRCLNGSRELASAGVIVDAKDAAAVDFYKKFGFLQLPSVEKRLFLPIGTIEKMFAA
jgi:predicted GNAT family N-acyltransferase